MVLRETKTAKQKRIQEHTEAGLTIYTNAQHKRRSIHKKVSIKKGILCDE